MRNIYQGHKEIIQFLRSRGGEAPTGLVVDAFADKVTAERRVIFRNLLKQCARLERNPTTNDGNKAFSAWVLKPEYDKWYRYSRYLERNRVLSEAFSVKYKKLVHK